jgi:hypothetical protein
MADKQDEAADKVRAEFMKHDEAWPDILIKYPPEAYPHFDPRSDCHGNRKRRALASRAALERRAEVALKGHTTFQEAVNAEPGNVSAQQAAASFHSTAALASAAASH